MALTPEQLQLIPEGFVSIYQKFEAFLIKDISRRIKKASSITDMAKWQIIKAQELGIAKKTIEKELSRIIQNSEKEIKTLLNDVADLSIEQDNLIYQKAGVSKVSIDNEAMKDIITTAINQTNGELFNITKSLGFASRVGGKVIYKDIAKYYHDALDLAVIQISSGTLDYNTAIRNAIKNLVDSGVRYVDYASGWSNKIDVAVRRAIMTGSNQMSQQLTIESMKQLGAEFVETTAHIGARPDHAEWQGKVFCYGGKSDKYPDFIESTRYGYGDGLGGWNCRHSFRPFFPGISERAYDDKKLKELNDKYVEYEGKRISYYEAMQKQRYMERNIRRIKNELIGFDSAGLKDDFKAKSILLKQLESKYKNFSYAVGIPTEKERLQVLGFNKSIAQKSVWENKKAKN